VIYEHGEIRWNGIDRGTSQNSKKNLSERHFVHQMSHRMSHWYKRKQWSHGAVTDKAVPLHAMKALWGEEV
jgi:hypothetical protein